VAVGGDVERTAILDNFCWGNPNDPVQLGMLVQAVMGCFAAATLFSVPFISGKDSLNNEYRADGQRLPVIPTLLISAVSVIEDASKTVDMSLKQSGNLVYLIGTTNNELLGSHYAQISQITLETHVPMPNLTYALSILKAVGGVIREGLVQSCHDLSEGGLAVAAAEMSLAGLLGMTLDIQSVNKQVNRVLLWPDENVSSTIALFSESPSRFLVEVAPQQKKAFEKYMRRHIIEEHDFTYIGNVSDTGRFTVSNGDNMLIDLSIEDLQQAWKGDQA
jgi:phosphoribosylformylglycinamidine synthase